MRDETKERMRKDRDTAKRAECFARLVLADREDHDGRKLLDYAERTGDRLPMQWEKTIAWLSLALRGDGVDETTLTGIGVDRQEVRHATVVQPRASVRADPAPQTRLDGRRHLRLEVVPNRLAGGRFPSAPTRVLRCP